MARKDDIVRPAYEVTYRKMMKLTRMYREFAQSSTDEQLRHLMFERVEQAFAEWKSAELAPRSTDAQIAELEVALEAAKAAATPPKPKRTRRAASNSRASLQ